MAVGVDNVYVSTGTGSFNTPFAVGSGSERALYALYGEHHDTAITDISYAGASLTRIYQLNNANVTSTNVYRILNPPTGTTDVVRTMSAAHNVVYALISLTGVDQMTPEGTIVGSIGNSTAPSNTVASAVNDLVLDCVSWLRTVALETATVGASQTQRQNDVFTGHGGGISTEAGAASVVMNWTASAAVHWNHVAIPVKAGGAAPPPSGGTKKIMLLGAG